MHVNLFATRHSGFAVPVNLLATRLYFMFYNFCGLHQSLRVTPAMAAGVSDHIWELREIVALLDKANKLAS